MARRGPALSISGMGASVWAFIKGGRAAWLTVLASLALSLIGVYAIDVATITTPPDPGPQLGPVAMRQLFYMGIGVTAAVLILIPHYRAYGFASWFLLAAAVGLLVFLLIPIVPSSIVRARNGARSWIDLGPADFQPSELAKIAYVFVLAWYLRFSRHHRTFRGLLPPAIITAIPVGLITLQPDLGTASLFVPALFAVLVAAGARMKHLAAIVLIAAMAAPAAYPILKPHQKERFVGLVKQLRGDTSADQDINMQSVTAQRVAGAGQWDGTGDRQSRVLLRYNALPERHNDMIFAVLCNRFGFTGALSILALYALWIAGALLTAGLSREPFGRLVPVGLAAFIAAQTVINVGMNLGVVPIIGITLPFVSHGGSSMIACWLMTGVVLAISIRQPTMSLRRTFEWDDER